MQMTGLKILVGAAVISGAAAIADSVVPGVPEGFGTWPAVAILGLICLTCLSVLALVVLRTTKVQIETATALAKQAEQESERGRRQDELNAKLGDLVTEVSNTNTNLRARPCIMDPKRMKRTQEIQP